MPNTYDQSPTPTLISGAPRPSLLVTTHIIYALHALSIVIGITSVATIIGMFVFGLPSIAAVIINYAQRSRVRGTILESHFRWQIRTFWFAALWAAVGIALWVALAIVLIGLLIGPAVLIITSLWLVYRIARGWLALRDGQPITASGY